VQRGHPEDLAWACHLGTLLVAVGFVLRARIANAIGFFWLVLGNVCWTMDLATGGEFLPTSTLTHGVGLALAIVGLRAFGLPRGAWWQAMVAFVALQQLTRWTTPSNANVNVAFRVWTGWEGTFPSYPTYMAMLWAVGLATFFVVSVVARRLLARAP
jgi:hypothetical protein